MRKQKKIYKYAYTKEEKLKALKLLKTSTIEFVAHRYHCSVRSLYRWKKQLMLNFKINLSFKIIMSFTSN